MTQKKTDDPEIPILTRNSPQTSGKSHRINFDPDEIERGSPETTGFSDDILRSSGVKSSDLAKNMKEFVNSIAPVVESIPDIGARFSLDSITLTAEIDAKGKFSILGIGADIGSKGGITLSFKNNSEKVLK